MVGWWIRARQGSVQWSESPYSVTGAILQCTHVLVESGVCPQWILEVTGLREVSGDGQQMYRIVMMAVDDSIVQPHILAQPFFFTSFFFSKKKQKKKTRYLSSNDPSVHMFSTPRPRTIWSTIAHSGRRLLHRSAHSAPFCHAEPLLDSRQDTFCQSTGHTSADGSR